MNFALEDKKGFGSTDKNDLDGYGTEQAVRALIAYKNAKVGVPYYLYQAGVKLNENRFQVNQPTVDETINEKDDVNTPDKEIQNGNKQEPVIKDTSKGMNSSLFVLALCASAGLVLVRKKA